MKYHEYGLNRIDITEDLALIDYVSNRAEYSYRFVVAFKFGLLEWLRQLTKFLKR